MGANVKINKNWKLNFSIESSIIKWFDGNVLGPEENNIFATNYSVYGTFKEIYVVKNLFPIETTFSRKIYKGLSGYTGLRYFIVQTSPNIPFYKVRQTLYLQMGVSYTF